MIAATNTPC